MHISQFILIFSEKLKDLKLFGVFFVTCVSEYHFLICHQILKYIEHIPV